MFLLGRLKQSTFLKHIDASVGKFLIELIKEKDVIFNLWKLAQQLTVGNKSACLATDEQCVGTLR